MEDIKKLTQLAIKELKELSPWKQVAVSNGVVKAISGDGKGEALLTNIYNVGKIAIANCEVADGTYFERHNHKEHETVEVYDGKIIMHVDGRDDEEFSSDTGPCYIPPLTFHSTDFVGDVKLIATTKPAAEEWPK